MIHTDGLTKHFRVGGFFGGKRETVEAVRGIDLAVDAGELVAVLGPNGAGKSTTLRMLTTLLRPTAGTARVAGHDIRDEPARVRHRIGYVGQGNGAGHAHRVRVELVTQGRCYGLSTSESRRRADDLLASLELQSLADRGAGSLSGGQRRRLDIAIGLMHRPPLLFLDEPSTGLDPQSRANLWEHIRRLRAEYGTTILLTTHYLDEADAMAERVVIIDHGRMIADGSPAALKADLAGDVVTVGFDDEPTARRAATVAERTASATEITTDGAVLRVRIASGDTVLPELLRGLDAAGLKPRAADLTRPTLDDVFLALTGRILRDSDS